LPKQEFFYNFEAEGRPTQDDWAVTFRGHFLHCPLTGRWCARRAYEALIPFYASLIFHYVAFMVRWKRTRANALLKKGRH